MTTGISMKTVAFSLIFLYFTHPTIAQNSLILATQNSKKNRISEYRRLQEKHRKQELLKVFNLNRQQDKNIPGDVSFSFDYKSFSPKKGNVRVAASTDRLDLGFTRQDFDDVTKTYENSYAYRQVYESEQTIYEYELLPDENGNLSDTAGYQYYSIDPETDRNLFFYRFKKINNKLVLTDFNAGLISQINTCGLVTGYSYKESAFSTINKDPDTGQDYIFGNSHTLINGDTATYTSFNFSPAGDTIYSLSLISIQDQTESYEQIFRQADGTIISGTKSYMEYDNDLVVSYKEETWNVAGMKWEISYEEKYTYNDDKQLIGEEYSNPKEKYEYWWQGDQLKSSIVYTWNESETEWINKTKQEYGYKVDTVLINEFLWEIATGEWVNNFYSEIAQSEVDKNIKTVINKMKVTGIDMYEKFQTDTILNDGIQDKDFYYSKHSWDGADFILINRDISNLDSKCRLIYEASIMPGQSVEAYYRYENPYDPSIISSEKIFESDVADPSGGITWMLTLLDELKFEGVGNDAVLTKSEYYTRNSGTGTKYEYSYNENQEETKINYFVSEDPNPDDGIDYWLASEVTYTYNEDGFRTDWLFKKRNSKNDDLIFFQKAAYTNNAYGPGYILGYEYVEDAWVFSDSSLYTYDEDGYNSEYKREFYENDEIVDGYINTYHYAPSTFSEYCKIILSGDSILINPTVEFSVMLGDGIDAKYIWKDDEGTSLSTIDKLIVREEGDYTAIASNEGCLVSTTQRVYSVCAMTITGDTELIGDKANLTAQLEEYTEAAYTWVNSNDEVISESASVIVDEIGEYTVMGIKDFCYGTATQEVKMITGLLDEVNQQKINIYPNPSNGQINIKTIDFPLNQAKVNLYNMQGKVVYSQQSNLGDELQLSIPNINKGLYILKIESGEYSLSKKVLLR